MEIRLFIASESTSRDVETKKLSLFNVLEFVAPASLPLTVPGVHIMINLERSEDEPDEIDGHLSIKNNEVELHKFPIKHTFSNGRFSSMKINLSGGLQVENPGSLTFTYSCGSKDAHQTVFVAEPEPKDQKE